MPSSTGSGLLSVVCKLEADKPNKDSYEGIACWTAVVYDEASSEDVDDGDSEAKADMAPASTTHFPWFCGVNSGKPYIR